MKLIKAIKLQRKLRIRQEYLCFKVCQHSQNFWLGESKFFNEYCAVNKAVEKVNSKLPGIYFFLSDLFGGAFSLRRASKKYIKKKEDEYWKEIFSNINPICYDLIPNPGFSHFK